MQRELAEEMTAHREMMPKERQSSFGSELRLREDARGVWAWNWLEQFGQDLVYAARMFRRSPGFTLGAVSVLALGVGVNLAEFQIFDGGLFHRLSITGADRILQIERIAKQKQSAGVPYAALRSYRENCGQCEFVVSEDTCCDVNAGNDSGLRANFVSGNYFQALRVNPSWGRLLTATDDSTESPAVVVLGYQYWKTHWAGNPEAVGQNLTVNGDVYRIAGVTPYDFDGLSPRRTALWFPAARREKMATVTRPPQAFELPDHIVYVKPRAGVQRAAVEAQITAVSHGLASQAPRFFLPEERALAVRLPGTGWDLKRIPPAALLIVALVLLVLLSACANLGNMLVARGIARQKELKTRIFLGAGPARMVRQLMTENLLLAVMGGAAGLGMALLAGRMLSRALDMPPDIRMEVNWRVVSAGVALALFSALAFGLHPALGIARGAHRSGKRRQILVGVQVAISCLLLISSAIIVRGAIRSATIDLAFDYQRMIIVSPQLYAQGLSPAAARQKLDAVSDRLASLPGVDAITEAVTPPLGHRNAMQRLPGLPPTWMNPVAPSYFAALRIPILRGRTFLAGEQNAVIMSESAARALWPREDPIGKTWDVENAVRTVVGIAKDSGAGLIVDSDSVEAYIPDTGAWADRAALIIHTKGDPATLLREIALAGGVMGEALSSELMRSSHEQALNNQQKLLTIIGSLSTVATALAAAGMFALLAFAVAQRTSEIGIRMAIGAKPTAILTMLLRQQVAPILLGVISGTAAGIALGRVTRGLVFLTADPLDPGGFTAGIATFVLIAALATVAPATQALRIDPAKTLRTE